MTTKMKTKEDIMYTAGLQREAMNMTAGELLNIEVQVDIRDALVNVVNSLEKIHDDLREMRLY